MRFNSSNDWGFKIGKLSSWAYVKLGAWYNILILIIGVYEKSVFTSSKITVTVYDFSLVKWIKFKNNNFMYLKSDNIELLLKLLMTSNYLI